MRQNWTASECVQEFCQRGNTATVSLLRKHLRFRKTKLIKMGWISKHLKTKNPESSSHCHCLKGHHKTHPYWLLKVLVVNEQTHLERHRIACRLSRLWQAADWHTPLSRPFNRGKLWKNGGRTHWKTQENCEGQDVDGTVHTRQVHTSWGVTLRWHTPQDHSIGEGHAKTKAGPCKIVENALEDPTKTYKNHGKHRHKSRVKVKKYKTGAHVLHIAGGGTLRWHTLLSTDAVDSGTSFG